MARQDAPIGITLTNEEHLPEELKPARAAIAAARRAHHAVLMAETRVLRAAGHAPRSLVWLLAHDCATAQLARVVLEEAKTHGEAHLAQLLLSAVVEYPTSAGEEMVLCIFRSAEGLMVDWISLEAN